MNQNLQIGNTLKESWHSIKGSKAAIWLPLIVAFVIFSIALVIVIKITHYDPKNPAFLLQYIVLPLIAIIIFTPFYSGAIMASIKRAKGEIISYHAGFHYFNRFFSVALTLIILGIVSKIINLVIVMLVAYVTKHFPDAKIISALLLLGSGLLNLLVFSFLLLSVPLVLDKNQNPFTAIKNSFLLVKPHWGKVFLTLLCMDLLIFLCIIPFIISMIISYKIIMLLGFLFILIAFIWLIPYLFLIQGTLYVKLTHGQTFT